MAHLGSMARKNIVASLFGPLFLLPFIWLAFIFLAVTSGVHDKSVNVVGISVIYSIFGLMLAYPATWFLGVPSVLVLQKLNAFNYWSLLSVGSLWPIPIALVLGAKSHSIPALVFCGALVSTGYWLVYKRA